MMLTLDQLLATMPRLKRERSEAMLPHLNAAMQEAEINTPLRVTAFLAQIGHESLDLTRWVEMPHRKQVTGCKLCQTRPHEAGEQYEGRKDLDNTERGDGIRYKGRGPLQITGRANYRAAGKALSLPLEESPALAEQLDVGFRVAAWFWMRHGLNALADARKFAEITQRVNGGTNGASDRWARYARALEILQK